MTKIITYEKLMPTKIITDKVLADKVNYILVDFFIHLFKVKDLEIIRHIGWNIYNILFSSYETVTIFVFWPRKNL